MADSAKAWVCLVHGTEQVGTWCQACMDTFRGRHDASSMGWEERAQEFVWWGPQLRIPFSDMHQRLQELAGRPIWTHELAHPERIVAEIRTRDQQTAT